MLKFNIAMNKFEDDEEFSSSTILYGAEEPSGDLGKPGDFYIETNSWEIYQKTKAGWGEGIPLKGKDGIDGSPGKDGESISGKNGENGEDGKDGVGIADISQPLINKLEILLTNGESKSFLIPNGKDGREIELQANATHIQWRYKDEEWLNLAELPKSIAGGGGRLRLRDLADYLVAGSNITIDTDYATKKITISSTGGGHVIQDEGTPLAQRANLNFVGAGVTATDDAGNDATVITIATPTLQQVTTEGATTNVATNFTNQIDVDNININGNTISTTNTNGDLVIDLNGTGGVDIPLSTTAGRFYLNGIGQFALNGGVPGSDLFYVTNADTGLPRANMVFASSTSAGFCIYEMRDIGTGNNWKMAFSQNTAHLRFTYNDTIKGYLSQEGKLRLTNGSNLVASARLHLQEDTGEAEIMRMDTVAPTTPNVIDRWHQNGVDTTDATVTTIGTISASTASRSYYVEFFVTCRVTSGTHVGEVASYRRIAQFKNVGGTVTQIGATTNVSTIEDASLAAYDAGFAISGTNILMQVTGAASQNVHWHITYFYRIT